jgi:hypothetical protein
MEFVIWRLKMDENEFNNSFINKDMNVNKDKMVLVEKIEKAYKVYKISEMFFKNVYDDYGKQKIAQLRMDFARHELETLLDEAREKGVKLKNNELIKKFYYTN